MNSASAPERSGAPVRVRCPRCQSWTRFSLDNRWRPFCSERCRSADLGAWSREDFRLPATPPQDDAV